MIGRKELPPEYIEWNRRYGAPFGYPVKTSRMAKFLRHRDSAILRLRNGGMFSVQGNNETRIFEYPWAYFKADLKKGMRVLEVGGGLSGFQFALNSEGIAVDNIDPGMDDIGGRANTASMAKMNAAFGTSVRLFNTSVERVELEQSAYDRAFSISVLEHLPSRTIQAAITKVRDALKPAGLFVLTVDLFLDLEPFSNKTTNRWGQNVSIKEIINPQHFQLVQGEKKELYGFEEFDSRNILANLPDYFIGQGYPTLVQTLVLKKT